ncbi:hypothetical protein ACH5RR_036884 [Cinchona calisaya]|uniref:Uncharacterized protein n=1 Tax=Cinchona calisaya TaxID=153742 RepID=A0ABD2Y9E7_9GENT
MGMTGEGEIKKEGGGKERFGRGESEKGETRAEKDWVLSLMEGFPLYGMDGCGPSSSKGPHIDLNLPPWPGPKQEPPETSPEEEERRRDWEELRASKEYKESE